MPRRWPPPWPPRRRSPAIFKLPTRGGPGPADVRQRWRGVARGGYITLNEHADVPRITADVKAGYVVRTRADADTVEARSSDTTRRDAALASGAQYVSTDYRHPETRFSNYQARLPDGAITVCNPVRAARRCAGIPIEP